MKNRFYSMKEREQRLMQWLLVLDAVFVIAISMVLSWKSGLYAIVIIVMPVTISLLAPFIDVPSMKKRGKLKYHSLLFLSERPRNGVMHVHGGTLFDYVFVLRPEMQGPERTNFILQQYLEGLLKLLTTYENEADPSWRIRGTSYILNERTLKRLGFRIVGTDFGQKFLLAYNYVNVLMMLSIAKKKLTFPNLRGTITFEISWKDLLRRKETLLDLNEKLKGFQRQALGQS